MRYKKAKRIVDIFPLLLSEDPEAVLLGVSLLKLEPLVANLNKHYSKTVEVEWPGFSSDTPKKFKAYSRHTRITITKKTFDEIFNCVKLESKFHLLTFGIISWIYDECAWRKKELSLPKYRYTSSIYAEVMKAIRHIKRNRNYSGIFRDFFYHYSIPLHGEDISQNSIKNKKYRTNKHTKKHWQSNRKYNTRFSRHSVMCKDFWSPIIISKNM